MNKNMKSISENKRQNDVDEELGFFQNFDLIYGGSNNLNT